MKNTFLIILSIFFGCTSAIAASNVSEADIPFIEKSWDASPNYSETKVLQIVNRENLHNEIPLTLVILKDSGWEPREVSGKLARTTRIFAQCNINFNPIVIIESRAKLGPTVDSKNYSGHVLGSEFEDTVALQKPIVYFAKNELPERSGGATAWANLHGRQSPDLRNSAMLFRDLSLRPEDNADISFIQKSNFEVMAHELAHILMDSDHVGQEGNLLSEIDFRTNLILPEHCVEIYKNFLSGR